MKKHSLAEFIKSKSFYALLCVGALAIVAITLVSLNQPSDKEDGNKFADLNEPIVTDEYADGEDNSEFDEFADTDNNPSDDTAANTPSADTDVASNGPTQNGITEPVTDGSLLENDIYDDPNAVANAGNTEDTASVDSTEKPEVDTAAQENETKEVISPETLYFDTEKGLLWPVTGNVLMDYSADKVVFFETLQQFKCNPAVIIGAEVGTEVLSATDGIITSITKENETGTTVTISVGSGYSLVYGQLDKEVKYKVGDQVKEGAVIGTIADPTMYYSVEGSNLYFQVSKDEETVNPMLLLR